MKKLLASTTLVIILIFTSSITIADNHSGERQINIVLAHGILGFIKLGCIDYFNGIKKHLEDRHNANVLVKAVHSTESIEFRGSELSKHILSALEKPDQDSHFNPEVPTHIIAHSMGGLDSRFLLSPQNPENIAKRITSLTTIGTPHQGSPIADLVYRVFDGEADLQIIKQFKKRIIASLSRFGIETEGLQNLTTYAMCKFNQVYTDNLNVSYFWVAGIGRDNIKIKTSAPRRPSYSYMKKHFHEDNDGAVLLSSARRGEAIGDLWPADHFDQVGHDFNRVPNGAPDNFDYLAKYDEIIARIKAIPPKKYTPRAFESREIREQFADENCIQYK